MRPMIRVTVAAFNHPAAPDVWLLEVSGINKNPGRSWGTDEPAGGSDGALQLIPEIIWN
jgi:hypothetical protein